MSEFGKKPGVCGYCGYRIRPEDEDVACNDGWDFDHEKCTEVADDE